MSHIADSLRRLGADLRDRRQSAGLSQVATAAAAGVGRSTLIHLEQGKKNVNLSSALAIAEVVGAVVGVQNERAEQVERRHLRADEALRLARRREAHFALAIDLALGRSSALRALEDARNMVALWKRDRTCSPFYIDGWSKLLRGDAGQVARRIRDIDPQWQDAMFQNTPFSRALASA
jgi:transcriptional regulator with XRE-family HTH domain